MKKSNLIAITGGIGSGKSRVSCCLSACTGLDLIDIDHVCRELVEVENPGWVALKENLGDVFFASNGQLDRAALRTAIFADEQLRVQVNQLIHPLALEELQGRTAASGNSVLVEVPLLYEAGWESYFQRSILVYAGPQTCCARLSCRDEISVAEAAKAITVQMDIWQKVLLADHVIDNRYSWCITRMQVGQMARVLTCEK